MNHKHWFLHSTLSFKTSLKFFLSTVAVTTTTCNSLLFYFLAYISTASSFKKITISHSWESGKQNPVLLTDACIIHSNATQLRTRHRHWEDASSINNLLCTWLQCEGSWLDYIWFRFWNSIKWSKHLHWLGFRGWKGFANEAEDLFRILCVTSAYIIYHDPAHLKDWRHFLSYNSRESVVIGSKYIMVFQMISILPPLIPVFSFSFAMSCPLRSLTTFRPKPSLPSLHPSY